MFWPIGMYLVAIVLAYSNEGGCFAIWKSCRKIVLHKRHIICCTPQASAGFKVKVDANQDSPVPNCRHNCDQAGLGRCVRNVCTSVGDDAKERLQAALRADHENLVLQRGSCIIPTSIWYFFCSQQNPDRLLFQWLRLLSLKPRPPLISSPSSVSM